MKRFLFICRANIGRSQIAALLFNELTHGKYEVLSAGTKVDEANGQLLRDGYEAQTVIDVLHEIGIDASNNVRTQLTPELLNSVDYAITMAEPETLPNYLKDSPKIISWEIPDLKDQPQEFKRQIRDELKEKLKKFIEEKEL